MMPSAAVDRRFVGRLFMVGFGCIGQGVLPLLLRDVGLAPSWRAVRALPCFAVRSTRTTWN